MCEELLAAGSPGLHFYTINLEKTVDTVVDRLENVDISQRVFPWRPSAARS
jgi:5,10-methylenetetrahydrofolate reductase